jgi:YHS domain-containing protein
VKDPETYLNELGITLACAVNPERQAVLDEDHRIFVNWETYFVSSATARAEFFANPAAYAGLVTDPVTRERFRPDSGARAVTYADRLFLFAHESSRKTFQEDPKRYATPMLGMVETPRK